MTLAALLLLLASLVGGQSQAAVTSVPTSTAYGEPLRTGGLAYASPVVESGVSLDIPAGGSPASDIGTAEWALSGRATWYDAPSSKDAAAGPLLREQLGKHWRGKWVSVCHGSKCVTVQLSDFCACGPRHGKPTLIDLDDRAFDRISNLGAGVISVVVSSVDDTSLPPTDTLP